jgi:Rho family, other
MVGRNCPTLRWSEPPAFANADIAVGVKLALVALKCDLRDDEQTKERLAKFGEKCITYDEGLAMAKEIRAVRYLGTQPPEETNRTTECSAKHNRGVLEAFTEASRVSLTAKPVGGAGDARSQEEQKGFRCVVL